VDGSAPSPQRAREAVETLTMAAGIPATPAATALG